MTDDKDKKGGVPLSEYMKPALNDAERREAELMTFEQGRDESKQTKNERDIRRAEVLARGMSPHAIAGSVERLKDEAVRAFFGEDGIPPGLKEGWAIYEQRRKVRLQVGAPLPPGGCILLGREATLGGVMAEAHLKLAAGLRLEPNVMKLGLKRDEGGRVNLVADVNPPDDWVIPVRGAQALTDPKAAAKRYIQSVLIEINLWFRKEVGRRLEVCERVRPELMQAVEAMAKPDGAEG